jgi:hypothetical protein
MIMATSTTRTGGKPPWERERPPRPRKRLSAADRKKARAKAQRAGRRYPNLVDNMNVAKTKSPPKRPGKAASAKASGRSPRKRAKQPTKPKRKMAGSSDPRDPRGGLSAAGRKAYARTEGARLRPGVTKPRAEMTAEDMRRKGSWARRFYGRKELPPLQDRAGKPTRFALTAAAWGEPVPRTVAAARKIAKKGEGLLKAAARAEERG